MNHERRLMAKRKHADVGLATYSGALENRITDAIYGDSLPRHVLQCMCAKVQFLMFDLPVRRGHSGCRRTTITAQRAAAMVTLAGPSEVTSATAGAHHGYLGTRGRTLAANTERQIARIGVDGHASPDWDVGRVPARSDRAAIGVEPLPRRRLRSRKPGEYTGREPLFFCVLRFS
jgi:hypothetical protein